MFNKPMNYTHPHTPCAPLEDRSKQLIILKTRQSHIYSAFPKKFNPHTPCVPLEDRSK